MFGVFITFVGIFCSTAQLPTSPSAYWPTEGWRTAKPEDVGMSSSGLAKASAFVSLSYLSHSLLHFHPLPS